MEHKEKSGHEQLTNRGLEKESAATGKGPELDDFLAKINAENEALKKLHAQLTKNDSGTVNEEPGDEKA